MLEGDGPVVVKMLEGGGPVVVKMLEGGGPVVVKMLEGGGPVVVKMFEGGGPVVVKMLEGGGPVVVKMFEGGGPVCAVQGASAATTAIMASGVVKRLEGWGPVTEPVPSRPVEVDTVNDDLDEGDIVLDEQWTGLVKLGLAHEQWTPAGDVHLGRGPLEGRAGRVGAEHVHYVVTAGLVKHHHGDLLAEGPLEQGVELTTHDDEEERHVGGLAHAVTVQVDASTHLVTCNRVRADQGQGQHKQTLVVLATYHEMDSYAITRSSPA